MAGTYHSLLYHLVFSTKNRANQITPQLRPRLYEYLGGIIRSEKGMVCRNGGTSDHVNPQPQVQAVGKDIATQETHRKKRDYRAELLGLLGRHRVEYDPRYGFD